jgi:hypothetical protein
MGCARYSSRDNNTTVKGNTLTQFAYPFPMVQPTLPILISVYPGPTDGIETSFGHHLGVIY